MLGFVDKGTVQRVELLMEELNLDPQDRTVVGPAFLAQEEAQKKSKENDIIPSGAAIELKDGTIVTGKNSNLMHASASLILNAIKKLAGIPDKIHLLAPNIIESIGKLKRNISTSQSVCLDLEEVLIALSISVTTNPTAQLAVEKLKELGGCEVHTTHIPTPGDEAGLRQLGINLTSESEFSTDSLFVT